ncbi:HupE/UreJ family protein [Bradyrhizobium sp. ISRA442]|uniref:HupE/UreJ family protein n=2 Tax=Bradyrhizobium sp. ISRA442 TaxID=2866197 RepID=UPI00311AD451
MMIRACQAILLLLVALALPRYVQAHEATLGVLEFREVRPGAFIGLWTMEPSIGAARVDLRVPPHCFLRLPEMNCGEKGLVGPITITNLGADMSAVLIKILPLSGEPRSYTISTANPVVSVLGTAAPTLQTWIELARTYVNYGIDHILLGADHLLFVLGLIWIVGGGWKLVQTITAFTLGHSVSLAAAAWGLIGIPERPLNACIALSIVFVGVEIVKQQRGDPGLTARYPWAVAFTFGLVHGIGFASALAGLGLEPRLLPRALLFFNVGVEIGQLLFVLLVLSLIWAHRRLNAGLPRWGEALPAYAIGSISMFWFFGRLVRVLALP